MKISDYIRIVLVQPTHPGNIGATARAMANMGVAKLILVEPRTFPSSEATARAAGADEILQNAMVVDDLDHAIADCSLVIGTSARKRSITWSELQPPEAMQKVVENARHAPVALLFGRESRGLTNDELDRCHYLVHISTTSEFPSINIASTVMVLLYELRKTIEAASEYKSPVEPSDMHATAAEMKHFYQHLWRLLTILQFEKSHNSKLHRKLISLFNRAHPYAWDIRMLRGIFAAIEKKIDR